MTVENAQNQSPIPYAISHRGSFKDRLDQLQTLLEHTLKLAQKEDPDDDLTVKQIVYSEFTEHAEDIAKFESPQSLLRFVRNREPQDKTPACV